MGDEQPTSPSEMYQYLKHGDIIQSDDEFINDDMCTWSKVCDHSPMPKIFVGQAYNHYFLVPFRRRITGQEPQNES